MGAACAASDDAVFPGGQPTTCSSSLPRGCAGKPEEYEEDGEAQPAFIDGVVCVPPRAAASAKVDTAVGEEELANQSGDAEGVIEELANQADGKVQVDQPTVGRRLLALGFNSIVSHLSRRSDDWKENVELPDADAVLGGNNTGAVFRDVSSDPAGAADATMGAGLTAKSARGGAASGSGGEQRSSKEAAPHAPAPHAPVHLLDDIGRQASAALQIMIENPRNISEVYIINAEDKDLGKGAFGCVRRGKVRSTGAVRAVKFVLKARMKGKDFFLKNEIEILKSVDHPNIIKLYELFEDAEQIYMVMEICSGGTLLDHLKGVGRFTEPQAARAMVQVLRAVYYLHMSMIAHRDLKPANVLLVSRDVAERSSLRVSDFGLSCRFQAGQVMTERVGTTAFMSPQVVARKYDHRCDTWSCGVLAYMLLCGRTPFSAKTEEEIRSKITTGILKFDPAVWLDVSEDGMSLIRQLLRVNPSKRCTVQEALRCEWLKKKAAEAVSGHDLDYTILENLGGFRSLNKFKRASLCIIASFLDEEQTRDARETFCQLDTDDDGQLNHMELKARLDALCEDAAAGGGADAVAAAAAAAAAAAQRDGDAAAARTRRARSEDNSSCEATPEPYGYTEFLAATFDRKLYCQKGVCWAAFNALDTNCDGHLSVQELAAGRVLGELSNSEVQRLVLDFDADGDGSIDFPEFMEMMRDEEGWTPSVCSPRSPQGGTPRKTARQPGMQRGLSPGSIGEKRMMKRTTSGTSMGSSGSKATANSNQSSSRLQGVLDTSNVSSRFSPRRAPGERRLSLVSPRSPRSGGAAGAGGGQPKAARLKRASTVDGLSLGPNRASAADPWQRSASGSSAAKTGPSGKAKGRAPSGGEASTTASEERAQTRGEPVAPGGRRGSLPLVFRGAPQASQPSAPARESGQRMRTSLVKAIRGR